MKIFIATASAALAFAATPAAAENFSVAVPYGDLDLSNPTAQKTLEQRVEVALREVCEKPGYATPAAVGAWKACMTKARANAMDQVAEATSATSPTLASNGY